MEEAPKRYLEALAFIGLNSKKHKKLKSEVKRDWVCNNTNSLSRSHKQLMEMLGGYKGTRDCPRRDPKSPGVALLNTDSQGRGPGGQGDCKGRRPEYQDSVSLWYARARVLKVKK